MKLKKIDKYQKIGIFINVFFIFFLGFIHADNRVLQICSSYQIINTLTNTISFEKNVTLISNQFKLCADKVVIIRGHGNDNVSSLKAYGNPVTIYYTLSSGDLVSAQSLIVCYDSVNKIITFTGDVKIKKSENSIQSDNIVYLIDQKIIQANSTENHKTITTLLIDPT